MLPTQKVETHNVGQKYEGSDYNGYEGEALFGHYHEASFLSFFLAERSSPPMTGG
jgi:hypothetical protein